MLDERPVEAQEVMATVKVELARLNGQISDLQHAQKMRKAASYAVGSNKSAEEHSAQVVVSLQSRLAEASSTFSRVLEERSQTIKAQKSRRDQFSATNHILPRTHHHLPCSPLDAFLQCHPPHPGSGMSAILRVLQTDTWPLKCQPNRCSSCR